MDLYYHLRVTTISGAISVMSFRDMLSKREISEDGYEKKKPNKVLITIIILAVVILALSSFFEADNTPSKENTNDADTVEKFAREQERRLEMILKKINGAGDVSVFISVDNGGEKVLARDNKNKLSEETNGSELSKNEEYESQIVKGGKGSGEEPYVVEERTPEISGVLVVAEGASSEKVRLEIYDAVKAVFGIAPHRIKITY